MNTDFQPGDVVIVTEYTPRLTGDWDTSTWGVVEYFDNVRGEGTVAFVGLGARHCVPADVLAAVPRGWAGRIHFVDVEGAGDEPER